MPVLLTGGALLGIGALLRHSARILPRGLLTPTSDRTADCVRHDSTTVYVACAMTLRHRWCPKASNTEKDVKLMRDTRTSTFEQVANDLMKPPCRFFREASVFVPRCVVIPRRFGKSHGNRSPSCEIRAVSCLERAQ